MACSICGCASPAHDPTCRVAVEEARLALFAGLFDDRPAQGPAPRVHLLAPGYRGDDPVCRRFALLETD